MNHSIKITLMAVLAMFTFNTVANAQFGLCFYNLFDLLGCFTKKQ